MKLTLLIILSSAFIFSNKILAQDDLENILNNEVPEETNYATATFKATRIMNGQSIERMPQGQLDFRIHHRFGTLNQGYYNLWGLDGANTHFSLEYGITNWLMVGAGRGTSEKTFDGFYKFSLWRQSTGAKKMPVSISWFSSVADRTLDYQTNNKLFPYSTRLSFVNQLLVARKFNDRLSMQLSPSLVHYNMVSTEIDPNNVYAMGIGGRFKFTTRTSFNAEYFYIVKPGVKSVDVQNMTNSFTIGFDIETGGHVFQLVLTNSDGMIEKDFIGRTTGKWKTGDIHFGFNISRVFDINHKK